MELVPDLNVPGVRSLDHTADVGIEVEGPDLDALFRRAALGMTALILGGAAPEPVEERPLELEAPDLPSLLFLWLRELLYWHEAEGFAFAGAAFRTLSETRLAATVQGGPDPSPPAREIKGVTYHDLVAERRDDSWFAHVIFDV